MGIGSGGLEKDDGARPQAPGQACEVVEPRA
jgi:hypothetical protein